MKLLERLFGVRNVKWEGDAPSTGELYKKNIGIAWPATIEGALLAAVGMVDTMMVGGIDADGVAIKAVGFTSQPRMVLLVLAQALCVGTTALIARRKGEDDRLAANSTLAQSMYIMTMLGVVMTLAGWFLAEPFMKLMGAQGDALEMASDYFRITTLGLLANYWNLCLCAGMRAIGKTRITAITNITANLVNVFLNYCLIGGNFGFPPLGVRGAAIATLCGGCVACIISICFASRKSGYLRFRISLPKFDVHTLSGLMRVGLSSAAEAVFLRVGFLINTRLVAVAAPDALSIFQIVQQVTGLSFTLGDGVAAAGTSLVGQSLGARRRDMAMAYVQVSRKIALVISAALMITIFCVRAPLTRLFGQNESINAGVELAFLVVIIGMIPQNGRVVYSGCLRGAGDARYVALCSLISVAVLRPICTYVFCYPMSDCLPWLRLAATGPWLSFVIDSFVRQILLSRRVKKGKWLDIKL